MNNIETCMMLKRDELEILGIIVVILVSFTDGKVAENVIIFGLLIEISVIEGLLNIIVELLIHIFHIIGEGDAFEKGASALIDILSKIHLIISLFHLIEIYQKELYSSNNELFILFNIKDLESPTRSVTL
jgi:hypothetical protein